MTAAGIDTDNNQLKAVAEAAGAEILVAMVTATATAMVTGGDSSNDGSTVKDSGAQRRWTAQGQLDGKGWRIGDMMTMDDKDGASTTAMSPRPTMEATKANMASRD